jgi:hypothetical protein
VLCRVAEAQDSQIIIAGRFERVTVIILRRSPLIPKRARRAISTSWDGRPKVSQDYHGRRRHSRMIRRGGVELSRWSGRKRLPSCPASCEIYGFSSGSLFAISRTADRVRGAFHSVADYGLFLSQQHLGLNTAPTGDCETHGNRKRLFRAMFLGRSWRMNSFFTCDTIFHNALYRGDLRKKNI